MLIQSIKYMFIQTIKYMLIQSIKYMLILSMRYAYSEHEVCLYSYVIIIFSIDTNTTLV